MEQSMWRRACGAGRVEEGLWNRACGGGLVEQGVWRSACGAGRPQVGRLKGREWKPPSDQRPGRAVVSIMVIHYTSK